MVLPRSVVACASALLLVGWGGVLAVVGDDAPAAVRLSAGDAAGVAGGACVTDGTANCTATTRDCDTACAGKVAGKACAKQDFLQINPTFPQTKNADSGGVKASKPAATATLCGSDRSCGPACVNVAMGGPTTCPVSTSAHYEVGTVPDPDSGACDEETRLERPGAPIEQAVLFAANGGLFRAFRGSP